MWKRGWFGKPLSKLREAELPNLVKAEILERISSIFKGPTCSRVSSRVMFTSDTSFRSMKPIRMRVLL
jgi:hypothetical protein